MIRHLRALAWLRWRLLVNTLRGHRRDRLERWSRIGSVLVPVLAAAAFVPGAVALGGFGLFAGWWMGTGHGLHPALLIPRVSLGLVTAAMLLTPLVRSMGGSDASLSRLILLPIPRRVLYVAEMGWGFADPWLIMAAPALVLLPIGLLAAGAIRPAAMVALAGVLAFVALAGLGGFCSLLIQFLFRDRRRGELATLVLVVVLSGAGFVPALFATRNAQERLQKEAAPRHAQVRGRAPAAAPFEIPSWLRAAPSELYGGLVAASLLDRPRAAAAWMGGLAVWIAVVHGAGYALFRHILAGPAIGSARRGAVARRVPRFDLPWVAPEVAAVAWAQIRTACRTVRGKLPLLLAPATVLFVGFLFRRIPEEVPSMFLTAGFGAVLSVVMTLLGLQPVMLNQFAIDGAGLSLEFVAPLTDRQLVQGKMLGCGILAAAGFLLCMIAVAFSYPAMSLSLWLTLFLGGTAAGALVVPVASLLSAAFPKEADLSRMGKRGNPNHAAALIGTGLTVAALGPPAGLVAIGVLTGHERAALAAMVVWTGLCVAAVWPLGVVAAASLSRRRENLSLVARGR